MRTTDQNETIPRSLQCAREFTKQLRNCNNASSSLDETRVIGELFIDAVVDEITDHLIYLEATLSHLTEQGRYTEEQSLEAYQSSFNRLTKVGRRLVRHIHSCNRQTALCSVDQAVCDKARERTWTLYLSLLKLLNRATVSEVRAYAASVRTPQPTIAAQNSFLDILMDRSNHRA